MKVFGLIGYPLGHSFSKDYFIKKFSDENIQNCLYKNFEMESLNNFKSLVKDQKNLSGLNVTIPFKEKVLEYLDHVDDIAKEIGSVNVIKIIDNKLFGYNSDYLGFKSTLEKWLPNRSFNALVLGSGGSSKAICFALKELGIEFEIVSTSNPLFLSYDDIKEREIYTKNKLIINSTPLGMYPDVNSYPRIQYNFLDKNSYVYDLVYNPTLTTFLSKAKESKSNIKNGLEMLESQAIESWNIWNK
ncbi:MAG: shikimate dehydrogenase [Flammeovirgaceae bacterium]|jgi:shikimate dehydrogenase|nr:shikimate dehydrogenase [Flammeovirgaceae bacterium]|tara:strand:+ start:218 stop:949 length:732 start_codon:yes stop_codon:yes gene_type:complete